MGGAALAGALGRARTEQPVGCMLAIGPSGVRLHILPQTPAWLTSRFFLSQDVHGAETVAIGPDGRLYGGTAHGWILAVHPTTGEVLPLSILSPPSFSHPQAFLWPPRTRLSIGRMCGDAHSAWTLTSRATSSWPKRLRVCPCHHARCTTRDTSHKARHMFSGLLHVNATSKRVTILSHEAAGKNINFADVRILLPFPPFLFALKIQLTTTTHLFSIRTSLSLRTERSTSPTLPPSRHFKMMMDTIQYTAPSSTSSQANPEEGLSNEESLTPPYAY